MEKDFMKRIVVITDNDIKAALMYAEKLLEGEDIFPVIESHEVSN